MPAIEHDPRLDTVGIPSWGCIIRIVVIPRWDTSRRASMNSESIIGRPVTLTGFSRIRGRLHDGEAMEMEKSDQEEVVHRSR